MDETTRRALMSSKYQKWETPADLVAKITAVYPVDLDLCASHPNVCKRFYSVEKSCFDHPWDGDHMFANPEYGRFLRPFFEHFKRERQNDREYLFLIPARTETNWFRLATMGRPYVCFVNGRLKFGSPKFWAQYWSRRRFKVIQDIASGKSVKAAYKGVSKRGNPAQPAPFPNAIIYHSRQPRAALLDLLADIGQVYKKVMS